MHVGRSYAGKLLRINLDVERVEVEEPPENIHREYLGGRALISRYLLSEVPPRTDPLGPDNPLLVFTGVLTGVPVPGTGRNSVGARSPLTGGFGESEVGGSFGVELKKAGYDGIIIEGRASHPVYLVIRDSAVELQSAEKLWGRATGEARRDIQEALGSNSSKMLLIGPAGENQVKVACIIADLKHAAGRCGLGAVMGSKNLKAIVVEGSGRVDLHDSSRAMELARWMGRNFRTLAAAFHDIGTGSAIDVMSRFGGLPTHNFRGGSFAGAADLVPYRMRGNILKGMGGCFACPIRCKKVVGMDEPYRVDPAYGGPEYETIAAFGSNCDIGDIRAVAKAHELCNAYSLDTISTGAAVSFAMECFEKGLLTRDEAGGLEVRFGDQGAMLRLVELIAKREGIGALLSDGVARAAERIGRGARELAVHVKGQEVPMHEPRWKRALGIGYAVSPTGAEHMANLHDTLFAQPTPDFEAAKTLGILEPVPLEDLGPAKVRLLTYWLLWRYAQDSLVMCMFVPWRPDQTAELVSAGTGWNTSVWELLKAGERAANLSRLFNLREGIDASTDRLPARFYAPEDPGELPGLDPDRVEEAVRLHYAMMGWTPDGVPTRSKLLELDLGWAIDQCQAWL